MHGIKIGQFAELPAMRTTELDGRPTCELYGDMPD